jgi:acetoin utilization protein AcuB
MLVQDRMTPDPRHISPETTFNDAFMLMKKNKFRRLPVVDRSGKLVGIVVQKDLLRASPSTATSLSVYEINY